MKRKIINWLCRKFYKPKCRHRRYWKLHVIPSEYELIHNNLTLKSK